LSKLILQAGSYLLHLLHNRREILLPVEDNCRQLRVAPTGITEELFSEFLSELLRPVPEQAFGDEDVVVIDSNEDIGLSIAVKGLPRSIPLEDAIQAD